MPTTAPIDVRDMKIVHETFRRADEQTAQLVRANPTPSAQRVTFLADHCDFGLTLLNNHHEGEDELLYPLLAERVPEQVETITRIEAQHVEVTGAIDAATAACRDWRAAPSPQTGEALAVALENVNAVLQPHLDDEEGTIVPLAAVTLTQQEWRSLGEHARSLIPRDRMAVAFGMLLEPLDEDDRRYMKAELPFPVRVLFPILIQRPWNSYRETLLHGT